MKYMPANQYSVPFDFWILRTKYQCLHVPIRKPLISFAGSLFNVTPPIMFQCTGMTCLASAARSRLRCSRTCTTSRAAARRWGPVSGNVERREIRTVISHTAGHHVEGHGGRRHVRHAHLHRLRDRVQPLPQRRDVQLQDSGKSLISQCSRLLTK